MTADPRERVASPREARDAEDLERHLRMFARNMANEVEGLGEGIEPAAVRLVAALVTEGADELTRLRAERDEYKRRAARDAADLFEEVDLREREETHNVHLRRALRGLVELLDGQTEPLHPVSWLTALEAARRALNPAPEDRNG
jgi:hypothetical protein